MPQPQAVLIVDDDASFAEFLRAAVEAVGHRGVIVDNGLDALQAFDRWRPQLVLLDILLPKRDGFQVCADLRAHEQGATVPIIFVTGVYKKASYERQALEELGATAYLQKPVAVDQLWGLLERHLGRSAPKSRVPAPGQACATLREQPLATLLAEHLARESTGVLFVRGGAKTYAIYLRWGEPVFIRSNDPADRLDAVLTGSGQVSRAQVETAQALVDDTRGRLRLGQALVRQGVLTEDRVRVALQLQMQLIFGRAAALEDGTCSFLGGRASAEEDVLVEARPRALLLHAARHAGSQSAVAANLPEPSARLRPTADLEEVGADVGLKPDERALARLADGDLTVARFRAVAASAGSDPDRTLLGLLTSGLLHADAAPDDGSGDDAVLPATHWDATAFARLPVGAAIADLHRRRATGRLVARASTGSERSVTWRGGDVVAVRSDDPADRLALLLPRLELAPEDVVAEAATDADEAALMRRLVASGHLTPVQAYWATVYRLQHVVHALAGQRDVELRWEPDATAPSVVLVDVPTTELIWDAVRGLPGSALRALMAPKTAWFQATGSDARGAPLGPAERAVFERLAQPARLEDLLRGSELPRDDVRRTVHALCCTGLVSEVPAPVPQVEVGTAEAPGDAPPAPAEPTSSTCPTTGELPSLAAELQVAVLGARHLGSRAAAEIAPSEVAALASHVEGVAEALRALALELELEPVGVES